MKIVYDDDGERDPVYEPCECGRSPDCQECWDTGKVATILTTPPMDKPCECQPFDSRIYTALEILLKHVDKQVEKTNKQNRKSLIAAREHVR